VWRTVDLTIRTSTVAGAAVLSVSGEIDMATIPRLHDALLRATTAHTDPTPDQMLIVDLDGVWSCDDMGLGVLLGAAGRCRESGGDLVVVCSDGPLRDRLTRTAFDRAIRVAPRVADVISRAGRESN
jgi:anti-sigma B factor antagonist